VSRETLLQGVFEREKVYYSGPGRAIVAGGPMNIDDALQLAFAMGGDLKLRKKRSKGKLCAGCGDPVGRSSCASIYRPYLSDEVFVYLICAPCLRVAEVNGAFGVLVEAAEARIEHDKQGDYLVQQPGKLH
jgi:hypothetical protein